MLQLLRPRLARHLRARLASSGVGVPAVIIELTDFAVAVHVFRRLHRVTELGMMSAERESRRFFLHAPRRRRYLVRVRRRGRVSRRRVAPSM